VTAFRIGEFHVEPSLYRVRGPAGTVRLEPKVMHVLLCLTEHRDQVVSKDRLMRAVWPDTFVTDDVLTRAISELRRVFGDDVKHPRVIETIPKGGYRLMASVCFNSSDGNVAAGVAQRGETLPIPDHGVDEDIESHAPRVGTRARSLSWTGAVTGGITLAAVSLMVLVSQRMNVPPSGRIVRSEQLTFTGRVMTADCCTDLFPALGTDGGRVYFTQLVGGRFVIGYASLGGGDVVSIPTPLNSAVLLNVSPDGSRLLVREWEIGRSEDPLWVIPTAGGAPLRLGAIVAHDAAWSPDGKRLAFARGDDLYLAESDGSASRKLTTTPGRAVWVRWSPDGTRLRFTAVGPQNRTRTIWQVSDEGRGMQPVPLDRHQQDMDCCGDWSPDGRSFFFLRYRDPRVELWAIRERTGLLGGAAKAPVQLTTGPMYIPALVPARTPGRVLVVGGLERGENLRFDVRTGEYARYNPGGWARWFASSRDRAWMAYFESGGMKSELWRSRVDGSEPLRLTPPRFFGLLPRWSPDGSRIAFMGRTSTQQPWKIYIVPAQGGESQMVREDQRSESDPDWSPDGDSLMFSRPPDYLAEPGAPKAIHILNLKSKELTALPGSEGLFASRWSPSGRYVAAMSLDHTTLRLFDFTTQAWTDLARFKELHNPVWSHDERFLFFEAVHEVGIYRLRISDRAVERVADLRSVWTADMGCSFEGLAPDESPLISCHRRQQDIFAMDWEMR
jgi:DNA-binding winged helix-turn-helix (wHTH) protein/Tol biopolymer transport system component